MVERERRRRRDLPEHLSVEELAGVILECIECLPGGNTLPSLVERRIVACLCTTLARHYGYSPLLISYLVRYPLAPPPVDVDGWEPPELFTDIPAH